MKELLAAGVLVAVAAGCGSSSAGHGVSPSLADLVSQGSVVATASGVGSKDLGVFAVSATRVDVDIQGTCVGTGDVKILVDTGKGVLSGGAACLSGSDKDAKSLTAGSTIDHAPISHHRVHVRVTADPHARWSIAVSTPDA